jgi:hypothetical protein
MSRMLFTVSLSFARARAKRSHHSGRHAMCRFVYPEPALRGRRGQRQEIGWPSTGWETASVQTARQTPWASSAWPRSSHHSPQGADGRHIDCGPALDPIFELPHACGMTRALACFLICVALLFLVPACNPCNRNGCDALGTPAADDGRSEIAGTLRSHESSASPTVARPASGVDCSVRLRTSPVQGPSLLPTEKLQRPSGSRSP